MRRIDRIGAALALALALTATGCLSSGGRNQPIRYWVLEALPGPPEPSAERRLLGVGPIGVPAHLDRPGIVTREGENRLRVSSLDQWGEPLARGISRVLSENLSVLTPGLKTIEFPWRGPVAPPLQLAVSVTRLDARAGQEVELLVNWALTSTEDARELAIDSTWLREPTTEGGVEGVVAALSRALEKLSREIDPAIDAAFGQPDPPEAER
jgi:uncharacterized lipoprotein YmbA